MLRSSLEVPMDAKAQRVKDEREPQVRAALKALGYDNAAILEAIKGLAPRLNHTTPCGSSPALVPPW
jgi:Holliday junction resolvasome RuvABC DNA-binding subunit